MRPTIYAVAGMCKSQTQCRRGYLHIYAFARTPYTHVRACVRVRVRVRVRVHAHASAVQMHKCVNREARRGSAIYTCSRTRKSSLFFLERKERMKRKGMGQSKVCRRCLGPAQRQRATPLAGPSPASSHTGRSEREKALAGRPGKY